MTLAGVAFQLEVDLSAPDGNQRKNIPVEDLLGDYILFETDGTYMGPDPKTGRPAYRIPDPE